MQVIKSIEEFKFVRKGISGSVGFVPTMGALHEAHKSLIKRSIKENDNSVVSIYINPTQFDNPDDFRNYPSSVEDDLKICEELGVDYVFLPSSVEMYDIDEVLVIAPQNLGEMLEGASRPSHFDGMLRVVLKLFNIVTPSSAYFGQKRCSAIGSRKEDGKNLFLDVEIVGCDLIREDDGLAYSSRNRLITDRGSALSISKTLFYLRDLVENGEEDLSVLIEKAYEKIDENIDVDYIEIFTRDFHKLDKVKTGDSIVLIAGYVGNVRLIDNILV